MAAGIIELDIHGMNCYQAKIRIDSVLRRPAAGTYRIRVIHGFNGGTALRDFVRSDYLNHPKVIRLETRLGNGITDLVLREL